MTQYALSVNRLYIRIYLKVEDSKTKNKWRQPQFQLHLLTKPHSRQELGLLTLSAAVHLQKMMPHTMFQSVQTFFVNGIFTEPSVNISTLCVCVCKDRLSFYYFCLLTL